MIKKKKTITYTIHKIQSRENRIETIPKETKNDKEEWKCYDKESVHYSTNSELEEWQNVSSPGTSIKKFGIYLEKTLRFIIY